MKERTALKVLAVKGKKYQNVNLKFASPCIITQFK